MPGDEDETRHDVKSDATAPADDARTIPLVVTVSDEQTLATEATAGSREPALVDTATDIVLGALDRVVADLCEPIREARRRGDDRAAGAAFEDAINGGLFKLRQPAWLFEELAGIRADALEQALAVKLPFPPVHCSNV